MSLEDRIARIEKDISYLRGVVEQMDKRLSRLENEVTHLRKEISSLRDIMWSQFRWLIGLILGMWIIISCMLLPILLKLL